MSSFDNSDALDKRQDNIDEEISSEVCSLDFSSDVHLGFIPNDDDQDQEQEQNELFLNPIWSDWDGGKMGGYPVCGIRCFSHVYLWTYVACTNIHFS